MTSEQNDIAVIGIGCRFPGADRSDVFFRNLVANKDCIQEIPRERWGHADSYFANGEENRIASKWGGFIRGVSEFDSRFFKIIPTEAELLDPQQKLFLTCSWEALEDAGYARRGATAGKLVGVYAGVTWNEFGLIANEYGYLRDQYKGAGSLYWGIPNRVSYFFDFVGPSIAVDTACSSSLVAVHLASQALRSGECEMALAGGVNLNLHPAKYLFLSNSGFLSSEGKCRGFGQGGDGYVPSEGVAVLVLKPLASAVQAGDRIYGVIKATATNHGGKATGYTVPNPRAHKEVIRSALNRAQVSPRDIGYIECHGTGTDLGDPIEIAGLRLAFEEMTQDKQFCGIGTVKSNIGHCEAAAGIAGLIKVLHSMQAGVIPATLHAKVPNKKIDFKNSPFYLVQENTPWEAANGKLLAGLSSFGAGGSNSHCVIQSYANRKRPRSNASPLTAHVVAISALNADRTLAYCLQLREFLQQETVTLSDICYTLRQREVFEHRVAFVVESVQALVELLIHYVDSRPAERVFTAISAVIGPEVECAVAQATRWVQGDARLAEFTASEDGKLVSLPTYAFEKSRSWVHQSPYLYQKQVHPNPVLHPLVDTNRSTAARGIYTKTLHRDEYVLDEHWVEDNPVLPGVCMVEMVAFAASTYLESADIELFDVWFLEPIALRGVDSIRVQIEISSADGDTRFVVASQERTAKHATGKIRTIGIGHATECVDVEQIYLRCPKSVSPEQLYSRFARSGIVQKGRFKVVTEFRHNALEAISRLTLSDKFLGETRYGMNPTLLDGAVQTAMVHLFQLLPDCKTILPFQIGSCVRHRQLESRVVVIASLKNLPARKYDITICDESGNVLVQFNDFVLREYKEKHHEDRLLLFTPTLNELPLLPVPTSLADTPPVCVLTTSETGLLQPGDIPSHWAQLCMQPDLAPAAGLVEWMANSADNIPRIAIVIGEIRDPKNGHALFQGVTNVARIVFDVAQQIARSHRPVDVIACIQGAGNSSVALAQAFLAFFKCLNLELPKNRFRLLELGPEVRAQEVVAILSAEFIAIDRYSYVRYQGGKRFSQNLDPVRLQALPNNAQEEPSAWIVTGAGGKLGMVVSRLLLERGNRVILLGRSELDDAKRKVLQDYPAAGWQYLQCDLTNAQKVNAVVAKAVGSIGGTWGIVHCAGTIEDGAFLKKEWNAFERVVRTKVESLLLLCDSLREQRVRRIVLFSSLTSLLGNAGQADYGFANGFLDGFAKIASEMFPSQPIVSSMNWPYWEEGGMKISAEKLPAYIDNFFTQPLPTTIGRELLGRMLESDSIQAGVFFSNVQAEQVQAKLALKYLPDRAELAVSPIAVQTPSATINDVHPEEKKREIQRYLFFFLGSKLKLNLTENDLDLQFSELGVDSIAQMDFINKLEREKRFESIPQTLLVENTTVASLTEFFYEKHRHANYNFT